MRQGISSLFMGSPAVYAEINTQKAIDNGFNSNTAVYSIVTRDAEKFATIPRYVYDAKKTEEKAVSKSVQELTDLINRPNPYLSQDAFFTIVRAYYKVCGEAFIWLNRGDVDDDVDDSEVEKLPVLEMYVLPPNMISVVPDKDNLWGIKGYILEVDKRIPLREVDVIHWKAPNMKFDATTRSHLRGMPPLTPGYKTLEQHNSATDASVRMYQNDGSKGILYNETLDKLKPEQKSQIKDVVDAKINSTAVKGAVATIQGKWGYHSLMSSIDMKLLEGKELTWKELCFLFGVPYELFDSQTTYANKKEAKLGWLLDSIIPASKQLDGELNRGLLKAFNLEGVAFIATDHWDMPEMQEYRLKAAEGLGKLPITPNEVRQSIGYEALEIDAFNEPWMNGKPVSQIVGDNDEDLINELRKAGVLDGPKAD